MFLTSTVPAAVPSDFHSSLPCMPSRAAKNTESPRAVRLSGVLEGPSVGHCATEAPELRGAPDAVGSLGAAKAVPAPARVTAAAVAAVAAVAARAAPAARVRRRSTFSRATRARTALLFALRRRLLMSLAPLDRWPRASKWRRLTATN